MKKKLCFYCLFSLFVVVQIKLGQKCNQSILWHQQLLVEDFLPFVIGPKNGPIVENRFP